MATFKNFEDIIAWQKARTLNQLIKILTDKPDFSKDFVMKKQVLGAAGSIMDNIAEGFERQGNNEFLYFLYVAKGSCGELRSQGFRARDFGYITSEEFDKVYAASLEISKVLNGLIESIRNSDLKGYKYKTL